MDEKWVKCFIAIDSLETNSVLGELHLSLSKTQSLLKGSSTLNTGKQVPEYEKTNNIHVTTETHRYKDTYAFMQKNTLGSTGWERVF